MWAAAIIAGSGAAWAEPVQMAQGSGVRIESVANLGKQKHLIAAPTFACTPSLGTIAAEMAAVIRFDLTFSGLFDVAEEKDYPPDFTGLTPDPSEVKFSAWRAVPVSFFIYGCVRLEDEMLKAECRLFDTHSGGQMVGKLLTTEWKYPRLIAHRFSEEVIRYLEGTPGVGTSEICFSAGATGAKEIYTMDYDGANAKQLTHFGAISVRPKLSPDGRRIAFLSYKDGYPFLYILDRHTGTTTPFSKRVGLNSSPAWAPDGDRIAFVLSKDGNTEVYLSDPDGSQLKRLTNNRVSDTSPVFSPDGAQIAYVSTASGRPQIFVMDADGGAKRRISYQGGCAYDPSWAPDGQSIAYVVEKSGDGLEIYVMDADGRNPRRVTDSRGTNESPYWSPDSRHVVFASSRSGRSELWAVTLDTLEEHRLSKLTASCQGPCWGGRRR